jgi:hypothetical protein
MLLATASCLWGFLFVYGFAHFGIGFKGVYKIPGAIFLLLSFALSALYLHQYFRSRSMTYWGGGLALLLAVLPLSLSLSASDPVICHESAAKWVILASTFAGGPLLIYGLFHLVEYKTQEQKLPRESTQGEVNVNDLLVALATLLVFQLIEDKGTQTGEAAGAAQGIDKEELKNFTLLLTLFLSLLILGRQFVQECWS